MPRACGEGFNYSQAAIGLIVTAGSEDVDGDAYRLRKWRILD